MWFFFWKIWTAQNPSPPAEGEFWQYTGTGTTTFDYELPAGNYFVKAYWFPTHWANGQNFAFSFTGTGVTEHGTLNPGELHYIWPTTTAKGANKHMFIGPSNGPDAATLEQTDLPEYGPETYIGTSLWQGRGRN